MRNPNKSQSSRKNKGSKTKTGKICGSKMLNSFLMCGALRSKTIMVANKIWSFQKVTSRITLKKESKKSTN